MKKDKKGRRGVSIVYISVAMLVLIGFCSLAVDLGRVQVAKTELERAIDAAARAAAMSTPSGIAAVQTAAFNLANANTADGQAVVINSINDVVFLNWPSKTALVGAARTSANAVQVTGNYKVPLIFAQVLGMPTATVHAKSTALYTSTPVSYQVVGLSSITYTANCYSDSYNSSLGSYASQAHGSQGSVASNGLIKINSGGVVNGNAYYSGTVPIITSVGGVCTGSVTNFSPAISAPAPTVPGGAIAKTINIINSSANMTLTAGTYSCSSVTVDTGGTLTINTAGGPVNLYCTGAFAGNGGTIVTTGNIPTNFNLYMTTSATIVLNSGTGNTYAQIYAPLSFVHLTATSFLFGSVVANTLTLDSTCAIHYDTSMGANGSGGPIITISQVQ